MQLLLVLGEQALHQQVQVLMVEILVLIQSHQTVVVVAHHIKIQVQG
jgi:hypothetical protein